MLLLLLNHIIQGIIMMNDIIYNVTAIRLFKYVLIIDIEPRYFSTTHIYYYYFYVSFLYYIFLLYIGIHTNYSSYTKFVRGSSRGITRYKNISQAIKIGIEFNYGLCSKQHNPYKYFL